MRLYLIRHGKAEEHSPDGRDETRALTRRGRRQADYLAERLLELPPAAIVSSPAVRARDTALQIAERLGLQLRLDPGIGLGAGPSDVIDVIAGLDEPAVALVGHNPTFSVAADILVRGVGAPGEIQLRTGEAAVLEIADASAPLGAAELLELLRLPKK